MTNEAQNDTDNESPIGRKTSTEMIKFRLINLTEANKSLELSLDEGDLDAIERTALRVDTRVIELQHEIDGFQKRNPSYKNPFSDMLKKQFDTAETLLNEVKIKHHLVIESLEFVLNTIIKNISEGDLQKGWLWRERLITAKKDPKNTQKIKMLENVLHFVTSIDNHDWLSNTHNFALLAGLVKAICQLERSSFLSFSKNGTHSLDDFMSLYAKSNPLVNISLDEALESILTEDEIDLVKLDCQLNHRSNRSHGNF